MNRILLQLLPREDLNVPTLLRDWREDAINFLRHDAPKILLVILISFLIVRVLRALTGKVASLQIRRLAPGMRAQQVRTLASVINSIGTSVIVFVAFLEVLSLLGLNLGPLLASAGIAGLAIGFGAQTLVKDFINGFFFLLEDQYNIGDKVQLAGLKGTVEDMTLRRTVVRDDDGTLHVIPNSQILTVSNMTRDWAQIAMKVTVAYSEPTDKVVGLLQDIGKAMRHDPDFEEDIVADIQVPGIDHVGNDEAEYLVLVKTRPQKQYAVSRELRRRIKDTFQKNNIQPGAPGRVYVAGPTRPGS